MYRQFLFEGDVHDSLVCVPLSVRRKLDLAQLKISLEGWQTLTRAERLALCHLPVDTPEELEVYREVLQGFCERHGLPLQALGDGGPAPAPWRSDEIPELLQRRLRELAHTLDAASWRRLSEEERFGLLKMSEPKRAPWKLPALLAELGLAPRVPPPPRALEDASACGPASPA